MKNTPNTVKTANTKGENTMNKMEYAQEIANRINGTVREVEKANGVIKTAVEIPTATNNAKASFYIDCLYEDGVSVEDAIAKATDIIEREKNHVIDIDFIYDFEQVKPRLRARLYNKASHADVFRSASEYGFDDLIITAYVEVPEGSIKVTSQLVKNWGVSAEDVLRIAEDNSRQDSEVMNMSQILAEMGCHIGIDKIGMWVATNYKRTFGAYALIAKLDEIRERFKNGFTVLPSSVHEVIIVEIRDEDAMSSMVQDVNNSQVKPEEQLSNHAYTFVA